MNNSLEKLMDICNQYDISQIKLYFDKADSFKLTKKFINRFNKLNKKAIKEFPYDITYKAVFYGDNSNYDTPILYRLEFSGYGVAPTFMCELTYDEFLKLLNNFEYNGNEWVRNDEFLAESNNKINEAIMDNYNDVLKYIISNLNDMREEMDSTLSYMYKYRMPFQQADRGNKLESAILSAISDYEVDNDYEEDEILDRILSERDLEDIFFDVVDNLDKQPINENLDEEKVESIEPELLSAILRRHGWSYFSTSEWVNNVTGQEYIRYVCSKDRKDASDRFEVFYDIRRHASYPQGIKLQTAQYNAAPEVTHMAIEVEVFTPDAEQLDLFDSKRIKLDKNDKAILESLLKKYKAHDINGTIDKLNEETGTYYYDDKGNRHLKWIDDDTNEEIDSIVDDDITSENDNKVNYNNTSFDDSDDVYDDSEMDIHKELANELLHLQSELLYYKNMHKAVMSDMENDPDVINDLDGNVAQKYGFRLGEIEDQIDDINRQIAYIKEFK